MSPFDRLLSAACAAGLLAAAQSAAAAPPTLFVTDLSRLTGGEYAAAVDINDAGEVIGYHVDAGGNGHPFLYSPVHGLIDFAALASAPAGTFLSVSDINDRGQVVGQWGTQGYLFTPKVGVQFLSDRASEGLQVNEAGEVVVHVQPGLTERWWQDTGTSVPVPMRGLALNERGDVAGYLQTGAGQQAAVWNTEGLRLLDTLPGSADSRANDIADDGTVVGAADFIDADGARHARAFLETATGDVLDLIGPTFNGLAVHSSATAIDAAGRVSGSYWTGAGDTRAFFWQTDAGALDVTSLLDPLADDGWLIHSLGEFNQRGQAVAFATLNGQARAVVLSLSTPVPEPAAWMLLAVGLPLLALRRRRG